jgi:NitT/TauT family transport system permease protein
MDFLALILRLVLDASASWIRMFIALGLSVLISVVVGIYAAISPRAERVILPVVDVLQTIPILAFFPFALYVFVVILPGYIGINAAVIFLIITSMVWNIIFGVYEAVKTMPTEFLEVSDLYHFNRIERLRKIYIPTALPRIVEQSILSWSIGLFYLVTSEIFSVGVSQDRVGYGIGVAFASLAYQGVVSYLMGIAVFVAFVIATRFLFFRPLENYSTRYMRQQAQVHPITHGYESTIMNWVSRRIPKAPAILSANRIARGRAHVSHIINPPVLRNPRYLYCAIVVALIAVLLYVFASNPIFFAYEAEVLPALVSSFVRVWLAFLVMLLISVPVCVYLIFRSKQGSKYMLFFQIIASVPATILLPAIAVTLKNGELVAFVVFLLSGIWYVIFSMMASTRTLPSSVFEVKEIFGVKGKNAWKNVYLKAILPGLVTGALTGIAAEWNASIVAEYFTTSGVTGTTNIISSVGVGMGKLLDLALAPGGQGLGLMALALLNLVVMILLINTFVWKRLYRQISKVYGS